MELPFSCGHCAKGVANAACLRFCRHCWHETRLETIRLMNLRLSQCSSSTVGAHSQAACPYRTMHQKLSTPFFAGDGYLRPVSPSMMRYLGYWFARLYLEARETLLARLPSTVLSVLMAQGIVGLRCWSHTVQDGAARNPHVQSGAPPLLPLIIIGGLRLCIPKAYFVQNFFSNERLSITNLGALRNGSPLSVKWRRRRGLRSRQLWLPSWRLPQQQPIGRRLSALQPIGGPCDHLQQTRASFVLVHLLQDGDDRRIEKRNGRTLSLRTIPKWQCSVVGKMWFCAI